MHEQQTQTLAGILNSTGLGIIVAIAILMTLSEIGYNVLILAGTAGLVSVGLGFGAQNLVRDAINGFFIVFEDQYVVGDTIRIGDVNGPAWNTSRCGARFCATRKEQLSPC